MSIIRIQLQWAVSLVVYVNIGLDCSGHGFFDVHNSHIFIAEVSVCCACKGEMGIDGSS